MGNEYRILPDTKVKLLQLSIKKEKENGNKKKPHKHIREPEKMLWGHSHILWKSDLKNAYI